MLEWITTTVKPSINMSFLPKILFVTNPHAGDGLFGQYKRCETTEIMAESLAHGYSSESAQRELSNEYQHDRV